MPGRSVADQNPSPTPSSPSDFAAVAWLCGREGRHETEQLASQLPLSPAQLQRLRERVGRERAQWLIGVAGLTGAAEEKLGRGGLLVTDRALQQSTDSQTAQYKASRFPGGAVVWDLCCGIGGDAMALARRGPIVALDRDPRICRLVAHNLARCQASAAAVVCGAVDPATLPIGCWFHIDPDRRTGQRRVADPQHSEPPPATIDAILDRAAGGAIKLAPSADVAERWSSEGIREWISRGGNCRQQVVWFGVAGKAGTAGVAGMRAATTIDSAGRAHTFVPPGDVAAPAEGAAKPLSWIFDFDPAVRAAGLTESLANRLNLRTLGGPAGFLTADAVPNPRDASPALYQSFRVLSHEAMDQKKLRRVLSDLGVGPLEIKLRGVDLSPEVLRKRLLPKGRPNSGRPLTLIIGRAEAGGRVYAVVAERCAPDEHV